MAERKEVLRLGPGDTLPDNMPAGITIINDTENDKVYVEDANGGRREMGEASLGTWVDVTYKEDIGSIPGNDSGGSLQSRIDGSGTIYIRGELEPDGATLVLSQGNVFATLEHPPTRETGFKLFAVNTSPAEVYVKFTAKTNGDIIYDDSSQTLAYVTANSNSTSFDTIILN